ncbi:MAG: hypothetical protein OXE43_04660 [Chloroflexi bacterium]|nr:hypothetical protein [Chloroflexota bacterium]
MKRHLPHTVPASGAVVFIGYRNTLLGDDDSLDGGDVLSEFSCAVSAVFDT